MFSAFSFGKIIKTVLPGVILTAALILLAEAVWRFSQPDAGLLLSYIPKDWITAITAGLIPVTMILGFLLNTFAWLRVNRKMRGLSNNMLAGTVYSALRAKLSQGLWAELREHCERRNLPFATDVIFDDCPQLEYYYLPRVKFTNLNYLWESYFCWYEFDINCACALVVLGVAVAVLLVANMRQCPLYLVLLELLVLGLTVRSWSILKLAAVKNLTAYEKNLMLLLAGSLTASQQRTPTPGADDEAADELE
jgi:hypothetical protein